MLERGNALGQLQELRGSGFAVDAARCHHFDGHAAMARHVVGLIHGRAVGTTDHAREVILVGKAELQCLINDLIDGLIRRIIVMTIGGVFDEFQLEWHGGRNPCTRGVSRFGRIPGRGTRRTGYVAGSEYYAAGIAGPIGVLAAAGRADAFTFTTFSTAATANARDANVHR